MIKLPAVLGMAFLSLVLVGTGVAISSHKLWSAAANGTVPYFCSVLALALLVVGSVSVLTGRAPSRIPPPLAVGVTVVLTLAMCVGLAFDRPRGYSLLNLMQDVLEVVVLGAILGGFFAIGRLGNPDEKKADELDDPSLDEERS